jgi:BioD-like phosphotransacetylase family protein
MKSIVIASLRKSAGKTSIITGILSATEKSYGYMKPFGDRLIYRKKKNWDYDSNLIKEIFKLEQEPESITLGFSHSKLRHMYDEESTRKALLEMAQNIGGNKDILIIEGGEDLTHGSSIHLDSLSVSKYLGGTLYIVVSGHSDAIIDDITFIKKYVNTTDVDFAGVIINKIVDINDFENTHLGTITEKGINVLGIIPYREMLTHCTIDYLAERLFAKVIAGDGGLNNTMENIFVGAMSPTEAMRIPLFNKANKLLITGGDRSDMIIVGINTDSAGIILTNNILPPPNILSMANEKNIPILLVSQHTFAVSKQIDDMEVLLTKESAEKIELLTELIRKHVRINEIIGK